MPDRHKKFHDFALKSILFKGRSDWYFCYLKTERLAHVVAVLLDRTAPAGQGTLERLFEKAASLPGEFAHLAAGEADAPVVLADVFETLSALRLGSTRGFITPENAAILAKEYEQVAEKLVSGSHPSPFISTEDFLVPELSSHEDISFLPPRLAHVPTAPSPIKDMYYKGQSKGQSDRASLILDFLKKQKSASIKDISLVIKDCSEKTIQRELGELIRQGLVRRMGERRWSVYTVVGQ